jgi:hypothetical protein
MSDALALTVIVVVLLMGIACASTGDNDTQRADQWFGAYAIAALLAIVLAALEVLS